MTELMEDCAELREEPVRVLAEAMTLDSELSTEEMRLEAELVMDEALLLRLEVTDEATAERLDESEAMLLAEEDAAEAADDAEEDWAVTAAARAKTVRSLNCMVAVLCLVGCFGRVGLIEVSETVCNECEIDGRGGKSEKRQPLL